MSDVIVITVSALVGLAALRANRKGVRFLLWMVSVPPLWFGFLALKQGGIVEPFTTTQMWVFCAITFWPAVACALRELVLFREKAKRQREDLR